MPATNGRALWGPWRKCSGSPFDRYAQCHKDVKQPHQSSTPPSCVYSERYVTHPCVTICIHPLKCCMKLCHEHVAFWRYTSQFLSSVDNWALVLIMKIVCTGEAPYDHSLLRQVSSLIRRLPAIDSSRFQDDFLMVCTHLRWVEHWLLWVNSLRRKRHILLDPFLWLLKS
jgi:hypothetical protein